MIMETVVFCTKSKSLMPFHTCFPPLFKPIHFRTGLYEELHFHLFEFAHTENELTGNDLITESLTYLSNTERYLHTTGFLNIQVIDKNTLCSLGTKIYFACAFSSRTHFGREHQVKLTNISPVLCSTYRANDTLIENNLLHFFKVHRIQGI